MSVLGPENNVGGTAVQGYTNGLQSWQHGTCRQVRYHLGCRYREAAWNTRHVNVQLRRVKTYTVFQKRKPPNVGQ